MVGGPIFILEENLLSGHKKAPYKFQPSSSKRLEIIPYLKLETTDDTHPSITSWTKTRSGRTDGQTLLIFSYINRLKEIETPIFENGAFHEQGSLGSGKK